ADQSGTWRRRRLHPLLSWINLALNTDGSPPREVFEAPGIRRKKLDQMGLTGVSEGRAGLMVAGDQTNRLIDLPLAAPDAEYSDAPLQLDAIDELLTAPLDMFFGKIRESNSVSVLH